MRPEREPFPFPLLALDIKMILLAHMARYVITTWNIKVAPGD